MNKNLAAADKIAKSPIFENAACSIANGDYDSAEKTLAGDNAGSLIDMLLRDEVIEERLAFILRGKIKEAMAKLRDWNLGDE